MILIETIPFTDEDLAAIEARMAELCKADEPYARQELSKAEALAAFQAKGEDYKLEILSEIYRTRISSPLHPGGFYRSLPWVRICPPPAGSSLQLLKPPCAYWRGDEKNKMLKRIYGISFPSSKELTDYPELSSKKQKKGSPRKLAKTSISSP